MNDYSNEPLVAREVSIRRDREQKLKDTQRNETNSRQVERDALLKVRQSDVTLPDDLTRLHGTFIYTNK
jgi:hypothetical protein